ncbi:hypothetical protein [Streptomyces sp. TLI_171]|uniref:hypothetical protein n=1 Tax=Streptomyces sp. TLI_171 TaxID=1938859 RepID=UPI000C17BA15|nr:hypothetical protein [Streptomyces sp. TLI_171]RKE23423.1 hypothetical protein BX266_6891 [Streptomyces sp. TLI_171]
MAPHQANKPSAKDDPDPGAELPPGPEAPGPGDRTAEDHEPDTDADTGADGFADAAGDGDGDG